MKKWCALVVVGVIACVVSSYSNIHYFPRGGNGEQRVGFECNISVKGKDVCVATPIITINSFPAECLICGCRADKVMILDGVVISFCDEHADHNPKDPHMIRFNPKEKTPFQKEKQQFKEYQLEINKPKSSKTKKIGK